MAHGRIRKAVTWGHGLLAPMRRFERPTYRLGGGCSILLSYMGICGML